MDLCCHNHSKDEKLLAIKALRNPPIMLPDHESMQDYIDLIEQEGLLKFESKDEEVQPTAESPNKRQQEYS